MGTPEAWVPLLVRNWGALQEGAKQAASLAGFFPKLLDLAGTSLKAKTFSRCSPEICSHETALPRASGKLAKKQKFVLKLI